MRLGLRPAVARSRTLRQPGSKSNVKIGFKKNIVYGFQQQKLLLSTLLLHSTTLNTISQSSINLSVVNCNKGLAIGLTIGQPLDFMH